jgi:predicted alpha/beta-fold hydrolase
MNLPPGESFEPFRHRLPWLGPDLQTLRDTLRSPRQSPERGEPVLVDVGSGDRLLGWLDPPEQGEPLALVLVVPGLGGTADSMGVRRLSLALRGAGLAVLRLNLRGAGAGRTLAKGTYAAQCNSDLLPVLQRARQLAKGRPLAAVGLSLGGTMLLNVVLAQGQLDALVCLSSPLDLAACIAQIEQFRNRPYERWLTRRLCHQTLADPFGVSEPERLALTGPRRPTRIRQFDALITAPRWHYPSVEHYYAEVSPLPQLLQQPGGLPPTLVVHAQDDPWVPVAGANALAQARLPGVEVLLPRRGGHNGFHAVGDGPAGCWSDRITAHWLGQRVGG